MPENSRKTKSPTKPKTVALCIRVTKEGKEKLGNIAEFTEAVSDTDLVRGWVRQRMEEYEKDPRYQAWLKENAQT